MHCGLAVIYASCDTQWIASCLLLSLLRTRLAIPPLRNDDESPADQQIIAAAFHSSCWCLYRSLISKWLIRTLDILLRFQEITYIFDFFHFICLWKRVLFPPTDINEESCLCLWFCLFFCQWYWLFLPQIDKRGKYRRRGKNTQKKARFPIKKCWISLTFFHSIGIATSYSCKELITSSIKYGARSMYTTLHSPHLSSPSIDVIKLFFSFTYKWLFVPAKYPIVI